MEINLEYIAKLFGDEDATETSWEGDNAFQGLQIIAKYIDPLKKNLITYGAHDVMGSVSGEDLIEAGITQEDLIALRKLNWSYEEDTDTFSCFV